jgi:unsaturated rhamnogalacturonyl hydrolase
MQTNDTNTPLHLLKPDYDTPYGAPSKEQITNKLRKILNYLEESTPALLVDKNNMPVNSVEEINEETKFVDGNFRLTSYEWGVTYAGMLLVAEATGNNHFADYTFKRLKMISDLYSFYTGNKNTGAGEQSSVHSVLYPKALDDAGALCAAMIKAEQEKLEIKLRPMIDNFINYISAEQYRLPDGTLVRNRPYPNTLWLDDLFMSVPALAQMGKLTGDKKYFDDAVKQVELFSKRMFDKQKELYSHGWVRDMKVHPQFFWGRANGWAVMAIIELLNVLPENHPGFNFTHEQFCRHMEGLMKYQAGTGFWHQLLNRNDSYPETSATAIITYSMARAINKKLIDKYAYAPAVILGWNAVASKINELGQVEGTCVGTGMGFDYAFYYYRPVNVFAAHGYGPALLAGAEVIRLIEKNIFELVENSLQLKMK